MGCSELDAGLVGSKHASRMAGRDSGEIKIGSQGKERWVGFDNKNTNTS
jgi:hypothetical protein